MKSWGKATTTGIALIHARRQSDVIRTSTVNQLPPSSSTKERIGVVRVLVRFLRKTEQKGREAELVYALDEIFTNPLLLSTNPWHRMRL